MAVINTNVKALFSQMALSSSGRAQTVAMQQLSTGKRINSARDDAAGMAIATRMTHQIRSLNQAVRNAGDAISLIQTAEGATNEITDMMQRMRELAIQASNDTNNNEQRSYLDLEFQQLKKQIVQIADNTEWNGFPVLNGSTGERVGIKPVYKTTSEPQSSTTLTVTAGKPVTTSASIGTAGVTEESAVTFPAMSKGQTITVGGLTYTATVANSASEVAKAFANLADGATTGASDKGIYDPNSSLVGFKTGAISGSTVTFTSTTNFSATAAALTISTGTTVVDGTPALTPTVSTISGVTGGGIVAGGTSSFAKAGSLSVTAAGPSSVSKATFTLPDGQILDITSGVSISGGVVTLDKTILDRKGMYILTGTDGDTLTLTQTTSAPAAAVFAAGDTVTMNATRSFAPLDPMYSSDVMINDIPVGASRVVDDSVSPENNRISSAIAKAAAINEKSAATGVFATVNPTIMTGSAMSGTGQATGTLIINGFTSPVIQTVLDNPRDSRIATVNAINFISAQTGVHAVDSLTDNQGITLVADDGRNIDITFNTAASDADFARLTGLKQGVQASTFSLESSVETPVKITSSTNGSIARAGLELATYDSQTLSTVNSKDRAQVSAVADIKSLNIGDLKINGVAIRAASPADDTLSNIQSVTSTRVASGIATAAAINASTAQTGVVATAIPVSIEGSVTSVDLPASSDVNNTQSLFINGMNLSIKMYTGQTEDQRRSAVAKVIHDNAGLTGVDAVDNGNGGITLKAVDGRNVSVWFDSTVVNAGSFGLGAGTVTNTPPGVTGIANATQLTTTASTAYASIALQSSKPIQVSPGDNGFTSQGNFESLGFSEGTFGGEVNQATSKMSPPRTGRLAFQVGANANQKITIDLADFGKGGPITGEITWDADLDPLNPGDPIPAAQPGGPNLQGKPLTRNSISSSEGAQAVLTKLDAAMNNVNQARATMGAVMNRLDHVITNLTNVSMNMSASRSQIEDADYASASTDLAKTQIMQQAATAVLAQANTSQQSVLKLLGG